MSLVAPRNFSAAVAMTSRSVAASSALKCVPFLARIIVAAAGVSIAIAWPKAGRLLFIRQNHGLSGAKSVAYDTNSTGLWNPCLIPRVFAEGIFKEIG